MSRRATPTLILGANLPDIDAFAPIVSSDFSFGFRRGWTHGLLALSILPAVLVGVIAFIARRRGEPLSTAELQRLWLLATGAAISHPLLDWLNTYGVRFLMPFEGTWFYGDTLFVVDPWFWLLCAVGVVSARSSSRNSRVRWIVLASLASIVVLTTPFVPVGAKVAWSLGLTIVALVAWSPAPSHQVARVGLLVLVAYIGSMWATSRRAAAVTLSWLQDHGAGVAEVVSSPMPGNPFTWRMVATTPVEHRELFVRWLAEPRVTEAGRRLQVEPDRSDVVVRALRKIPGTATWLRIPSFERHEREHSCLVIVRDLRYTWEGDAGFAIEHVELDDEKGSD